MEDSGEQFDVIVVGAGIMGSCAAYEAAKRGHRVLLLERFDFLHNLGSSHGESRTIRTTYPEPYYHSMVMESFHLWDQAQSAAGYRVLTPTKQLDIGSSDDNILKAVISSCKLNSIDYQVLDGSQVSSLFHFRLPEGFIGVVTEMGGVIKPTKAVAMFQSLAARSGAVLRDRIEVTAIESGSGGGGVWVSTAGGERFYGRKCVVAVGAWTRKMVEEVTGKALPIQPLHTTVCYWRIKEGYEHAFTVEGGFPTFAIYGDPCFYGTPSMEFPGLIKIALNDGETCDPDRREWELSSSVSPVVKWIQQVLPGCLEVGGEPVIRQACMYSMTPDEDYIIDFLGGEFGRDVVVAGGFSGHGFKMGPVIGRILADMAVDGEARGVEMKYFKIGRFDDNPKGNPKVYEDQAISQ